MNEKLNQKLLIGILIIAILGAGTLFIINREPSQSQLSTNTGPVKRKIRTNTQITKETNRKQRPKSKDKITVADRKKRDRFKNQASTKRKTRLRNNKQVKKKILQPMG